MGTQRDVDRVSHERYSRYFDLLESTEQTSLEAARAYYDVLRFRRLVALAEDNYVQHRYVSKQTQARFSAGVGRGVDFEQVNARLALAESNLTTETANLNDVMARYLRVVGAPPPASPASLTVLHVGLPDNKTETVKRALTQSPSISAAVESLRAAQMAAKVRDGAFQPKIEARVRSGFGNNYEGTQDQRRDTTAEIVLNWNLYNGGTDRARVREAANLINQAEDLRDKACRDVRQTADIAFNDTRKLTDQLVLLDRNTVAIEKARDAYRQQFDIGQRSLLDLLNSENEVYTARRSYANAEYDRALAFARTHGSWASPSPWAWITTAILGRSVTMVLAAALPRRSCCHRSISRRWPTAFQRRLNRPSLPADPGQRRTGGGAEGAAWLGALIACGLACPPARRFHANPVGRFAADHHPRALWHRSAHVGRTARAGDQHPWPAGGRHLGLCAVGSERVHVDGAQPRTHRHSLSLNGFGHAHQPQAAHPQLR
jgi:TolC family type I secretion outer membrane protein